MNDFDCYSMNPALGEFLFVLRFLVEEWGAENTMILIPERWQAEVRDCGVPVYCATDNSVTVFVDCPDHYIQYHMPVSDLLC